MIDLRKTMVRRGPLQSALVLTTNDRAVVSRRHTWGIGIRPAGDVVVGLVLAEVAAFDGVSAIVDQEDHRLVVAEWSTTPDLERSIVDEQNVARFGRGRKRIVEDIDPFSVPAGFFLGLARRG